MNSWAESAYFILFCDEMLITMVLWIGYGYYYNYYYLLSWYITKILNTSPHRLQKKIQERAIAMSPPPHKSTHGGMPSRKLKLKVNCVMLIRNLNTSKSLVNGTRMRVKVLHHNLIDCEILTGSAKGTSLLIPRINLTISRTILPFEFQRIQFPVCICNE